MQPSDLPKGALPGPATIAGDVLYLGNWAVEIKSSRVLWCLAELRAKRALVPVDDLHSEAEAAIADPQAAGVDSFGPIFWVDHACR